MVEIIKRLQAEFPEIDVSLNAVEQLENIPVFQIRTKNEKYLSDNWKKMSNMIAAVFQTTLRPDQDFERWNTYIFYICAGPVTRFLRGRIENNKFSSRKIVIANSPGQVDLEGLISKYITGEVYLKEFTDRLPAAAALANTFPEMKRRNDSAIDLQSVIGERFVIDRTKKNREILRELLDTLEERLGDETIKG